MKEFFDDFLVDRDSKVKIVGIGNYGNIVIEKIKKSPLNIKHDDLYTIKLGERGLLGNDGVTIYIYDIDEDRDYIDSYLESIPDNSFNVSIVEYDKLLTDNIVSKFNTIVRTAGLKESVEASIMIKGTADIPGLIGPDVDDAIRVLSQSKCAHYISVDGEGPNRSVDTAKKIIGLENDICEKSKMVAIYASRNISLQEINNTLSILGNISETSYYAQTLDNLKDKYIVSVIFIDEDVNDY